MSEALVTLTDASVRFGDLVIVDAINLTVSRGDIVTVIGPNGAGKTTLIKAVLGLQPISTGTLTRAPGLRTGYVPQHIQFQPTLPLTVKRFMSLTGAAPAACREALERTSVAHLYNASIHHLSGGEMQRLLIARALVREPDLLVLDEPAQGVDVNGQAALYDLIRTLRDTLNCGVIMISHDLHLVMAATDKVLCLNQHVCCSGYPEQVSNDPAFVELFGRHVAESVAVYHHHHNHRHDLHGDVVGHHHGHGDHHHDHPSHDAKARDHHAPH
ncbi:zinc ABC transporter ATP-binding protein ZnuC [Marinobacter sp. BGYM27]|uniref:zinc ABC transporter ATP-binding protein ZnuC n=1 Tax=unclassified Marinobacter TaxID=83889 RepID=UPI000C5AE6CC|nr:zinc ABC transporter ATP-binding protein ZnuC [Marinobacter sp. BGYM27]MBH86954.1 zinc ABC transporter ATP-binding protein ZnuC [Alteromonadaceae bacterium]MDG5501158.1 zinc ABC transporter ATP-binding protein ZnuC [Marinobacter sp. BGYM27]|tara:strand:- start:14074 stop:14886 length:813 start_codon:yes stop_codon:yes gene_type:complete